MLSKYYLSIAIPLILLLIACSPIKVNVYKVPETAHQRYNLIIIPDFRKTESEWVPYDSGVEIADMVAERLRKDSKFTTVSRSSGNVDRSDGKRTLIVSGVVTGYVRGCKYCEYIFMGFRDKGKMSVQVWVRLTDNTTGETLAEVGIDGRAKAPGTGRSKYIRVVNEIVKVIDAVNSRQL